jgi:hypothetical protein
MSSILRELNDVQDQLGSLATEARADKLALLSRREELQTQAARLADQVDRDWSTQELLAHLASLRWQRDAIGRQRGAAPLLRNGPSGTYRTMHREGLPRIEARIARIKVILAERGIDLR